MNDRAKKVCFFEKTFLLADISMDLALKMFFFTLSNADVHFTNQKLHWRFYIIAKALLTTCRLELINQKKFVMVTLGKNNKVFVVYVKFLIIGSEMSIHCSRAA